LVAKQLNYKILFWTLIIFLIFDGKSFSYEKLIYPEGKREEIVDLFFKSLQKKEG